MATVRVTHYSDILCIWAYICQIRVEELQRNFAGQVELNYCLFPVFGATEEKLDSSWGSRGGVEAYNRHVLEIVEQFPHVSVHQDIWLKAAPKSSLPAHLYLLATRLIVSEGRVHEEAFAKLAQLIRRAFFTELQDVSNTDVLLALLEQVELPVDEIRQKIKSGQAYAAMASDIQHAQSLSIRSSPTMLFNEDRQRLAGNVGYRIIEANIRELLEQPEAQQTWC